MDNELHILQHSLGVDQYGRGDQYRNHFVTGPGSTDYDACMSLVDKSLMTRRPGSELSGGDDIFRVTDAGKAHVAEHSPAPPKLTRSQQRYSDYLDADSDLSFIDWLKRHRSNPFAPASQAVASAPAAFSSLPPAGARDFEVAL